MHHAHLESSIAILILPTLITAIISWFFYRRYSGLARGASWLAWLGTLFIVAWIAVPRIDAIADNAVPDESFPGYLWAVFCAIAFAWLAGPFVARLWGKWVDGRTTEAERAPGPEAWRAWLAGRHVIYALLLAFFASQGWSFSLVVSLLVFGGALAIYPAILAVGQSPSSAPPPTARPISAEREKVMDLLSAGKITAEESAELLNALGASATAESSRPAPLSSPQRLMLIGAALVLLGFFLPWFAIDGGRELNHAFSQFRSLSDSLQQNFQDANKFPGIQVPGIPNFTPGTLNIRLSGGDIPHGLGWVALLLGLAAAAVPYIAHGLDNATRQTVRLGALAVGSFIILYLLSENIRFVSFGFALAIAGYALEWIGFLRQPRIVHHG